MFNWLVITIIAYAIMAFAQLLDKVFLNVAFKDHKAFVALVGLLSIFVIGFIPFGVSIPSFSLILIALFGGALFIAALIPFFSALQADDASKVIPIVGALIPITTLLGEQFFLSVQLDQYDFIGFILLVVGSVLLTRTKSSSSAKSKGTFAKGIIGAILFGASFVVTKYIFEEMEFVNGFFWLRLGGVFVSLYLLLVYKSVRKGLIDFFKKKKKSIQVGYFATQGLAAGGFFLQNIAIDLSSVSLVNALQGVQYVFIVFFVGFASKFKPKLLGEKLSTSIIIEKLVSIAIIIGGIIFVSL